MHKVYIYVVSQTNETVHDNDKAYIHQSQVQNNIAFWKQKAVNTRKITGNKDAQRKNKRIDILCKLAIYILNL